MAFHSFFSRGTIGVYLFQLFLLYLQEKQALEKRVSNMEDELKVSACKNKLCILTLGLNSKFCLQVEFHLYVFPQHYENTNSS